MRLPPAFLALLYTSTARTTLAYLSPLEGTEEAISTPPIVKRSPVPVLEQGSSSASSTADISEEGRAVTDPQRHQEEYEASQAQLSSPIDPNRPLWPHLSDQEYVMTLVGDESGGYRWPDWVPQRQGREGERTSSHAPHFHRGESSRAIRENTASDASEGDDNSGFPPQLEHHFDDLQISGEVQRQQQREGLNEDAWVYDHEEEQREAEQQRRVFDQQRARVRQRRERTRQAHVDQAGRLTEMDLRSEVDATRAELNALMQIPGIHQGYTGDLRSLRGQERQQEIERRYDAERQLIRSALQSIRGGQGRESSTRLLLQHIPHGVSRVLVDNYNSQVQSLQHLLLQRSSLRQDSHSTEHIDTLIRSQAHLARQTFRTLQRRLRNVHFKYDHLMEQLRPQRPQVAIPPRAP